MPDTLRLEPLLYPAAFGAHRTRVLVDGLDVVAAAYGAGGFAGQPVTGFRPSQLLGPRGLPASAQPRRIALGGSDTTEDQLTVQIQQTGPTVIWEHWRLLGTTTEVKLGTFHFDARNYTAELARATTEAERTWPARTVAELLHELLSQDGGTWIRRTFAVRAPTERPDLVEVSYYARDPTGLRYAMPGHYVVTFPVDTTDPGRQARTIAHRLHQEDLKPLSVHQPRRRRGPSTEKII